MHEFFTMKRKDGHDWLILGLFIAFEIGLYALYRHDIEEIRKATCRGEAEISGYVYTDKNMTPISNAVLTFTGLGKSVSTQSNEVGEYHTHLDVVGETRFVVSLEANGQHNYIGTLSVNKGERKQFDVYRAI